MLKSMTLMPAKRPGLKVCETQLPSAGAHFKMIKQTAKQKQKAKQVKRRKRERELGKKQLKMPDRVYGVIYADPPWRFEPYSRKTGMDRAADNHYPTMDSEAIMRLGVPAANDCVLFLWATAPMLIEAIYTMWAWGFAYKSNMVWVKDKIGTGYWTRNQHELLLIGTRGKIPAPAPGSQWPSVIEWPRLRHSAKPTMVRTMIENWYPTVPKIELFARERADGWAAWGQEV